MTNTHTHTHTHKRKASPKINLFTKVVDAIVSCLITYTAYLYFLVLCKGEIYNEIELTKTIKSHDRYIIAMNHESYLDWIILWAVFKYRYKMSIIFLAKEKLFKHWLWSKLMRYGNCIRVMDDGSKIIDETATLKLQESIIGIFPEGTRSRDGNLLVFKPGVAILAAKQNIPILPISLNGFYEAWKPNTNFPKIFKMEIVVNQLIENNINYSVRDYLTETRKKILTGKNINKIESANINTAVFDLDSTLLKTNIASLLFFINRKRKSKIGYILWLIKISPLIPILKIIDKFYRPLTQLIIFNMYLGYSDETIKLDCEEYLSLHYKNKLIKESYEFLKILRGKGVDIYILSTNLHVFVNSISNRISAKGIGVSLDEFRKLSTFNKIKYLEQFKQNTILKENLTDFIGVGDSKYDMPIFTYSNYSILVCDRNKKNELAKYVNHSIKV